LKRIGFAIGAAAGIAAAALLLSRREAAPPPPIAAAAPAPGAATRPALEARDADDELAPDDDVPRGDSRLSSRDGLVTLVAREASRRVILKKLAHAGDFEVADYTPGDARVTVRAVRVSIPQAIAATLADTAYAIHFAPQAEAPAPTIRLLEVGVPPAVARVRAPEDRVEGQAAGEDEERAAEKERERIAKGEPPSARAPWEVREQTPEELAAWRASHAGRERRWREETLGQLEAASAEDRAFAVFSLDPARSEDLVYLTRALEDPEPSVRSEAVRQLGFADARDALPALGVALRDPSSDVVLEAIDALVMLHDPAAASPLRGLERHPDERVREAASAALADLE
jgi:hypothetical protein